jgi:hypothetical protein
LLVGSSLDQAAQAAAEPRRFLAVDRAGNSSGGGRKVSRLGPGLTWFVGLLVVSLTTIRL